MTRVHRGWGAPIWISLLALLLPTLATAQADEAPLDTELDPAAVEILRESLAPIQGAKSLSVQYRALYDVVQRGGHKLQFTSQATAKIRRPDRLQAITLRDDGRSRELRYDGETVTVYDAVERAYGQFPVPDTLDATFDYIELEIGMPLPLSDLFYSDLSHLSGMGWRADVVGESRVGPWDCDHVVFQGETVDWQLWVERGDARTLRKFVITYHDTPGEPQYGAIFDRWDLELSLPDADFVFVPPDGAERIPVLARPAGAEDSR